LIRNSAKADSENKTRNPGNEKLKKSNRKLKEALSIEQMKQKTDY
jgi:hypothetical protein